MSAPTEDESDIVIWARDRIGTRMEVLMAEDKSEGTRKDGSEMAVESGVKEDSEMEESLEVKELLEVKDSVEVEDSVEVKSSVEVKGPVEVKDDRGKTEGLGEEKAVPGFLSASTPSSDVDTVGLLALVIILGIMCFRYSGVTMVSDSFDHISAT